MQIFDSFSHSSPHNCAPTALSFLHIVYTWGTAHTMQTTHNFKLPLLPAKHIFFQKAVLYAEAVRFLVLFFPPIEFFLLLHALLSKTPNNRSASSKYSFSHFAIKGTKDRRVCLAQTTQVPEVPYCPPKPHLLKNTWSVKLHVWWVSLKVQILWLKS